MSKLLRKVFHYEDLEKKPFHKFKLWKPKGKK